ncbi:MAG: J domain-containing protein [Acidobacteriota bacterium]
MGNPDSMRLDQARALLGVSTADDIEAVKSAYRKLAFKLHPDLHPDDLAAKRKFQRLNEAYLLLRHFLADRDQRGPGPAAEEQAASGGAKRPAGPDAQAKARSGRPGPTPPPPGPEPGFAHSQRKAKQAYTQASRANADAGFYFRREEVLQDLLKDPFARQVFEDIYRQVKSDPARNKRVAAKGAREVSFSWGDKAVSLDMSKGFIGSIKDYLRKQLDDEQTVHLPSSSLLPGTRIRVGIRHGLGNAKPTMVEVTLPVDFVVGRPIRLKGMGRRIGPMRGDLYLRLLAK